MTGIRWHMPRRATNVSVFRRGNRANLLLPDGTNVWLNAGTSLRYPVAFKGKSREVELNGEAYFEVSKSEKPFVVKTDRCDVEVLGTTFDVEAYADETEFRTTLYEGAMQLQAAGASEKVVLHPGDCRGRRESAGFTDQR